MPQHKGLKEDKKKFVKNDFWLEKMLESYIGLMFIKT